MGRKTYRHCLRVTLAPLLLLLLCLSCEAPVDPGFQIREPELVVSSTFFPDAPVKVRLSSTGPAGGQQILSDISDAKVIILEGDAVAETLKFVPATPTNGAHYIGDDFRPVVGRVYTLFASKNGFVPFEAASAIPIAAPITELTTKVIAVEEVDGVEVYSFDLFIGYDDPEMEENYYDLRVSQVVTPYYINETTGDTILQDIVAKVVQGSEDALRENTRAGETSILLRDHPIPGGVKVRLQSSYNPERELLGILIAELRTVSPAYFEYQLSLQREGEALPIGLGDPRVNEGTIGNAASGVGVFGGYSRSVSSVMLSQDN